MQYNPPPGSQDPDASYVNGVPGVQKGSPVNAGAVEFPQREIINVILAAGLEPSNEDMAQLLKAIEILAGALGVPFARKVNTALPLTGGGPLGPADLTIAIKAAAVDQSGAVALAAESDLESAASAVTPAWMKINAGLAYAATAEETAAGQSTDGRAAFITPELAAAYYTPMPSRAGLGYAVGHFETFNTGTDGRYTVPPGGKWFLFLTQFKAGGDVYSHQPAQLVAGGTVLRPQSSFTLTGAVWRLA